MDDAAGPDDDAASAGTAAVHATDGDDAASAGTANAADVVVGIARSRFDDPKFVFVSYFDVHVSGFV